MFNSLGSLAGMIGEEYITLVHQEAFSGTARTFGAEKARVHSGMRALVVADRRGNCPVLFRFV